MDLSFQLLVLTRTYYFKLVIVSYWILVVKIRSCLLFWGDNDRFKQPQYQIMPSCFALILSGPVILHWINQFIELQDAKLSELHCICLYIKLSVAPPKKIFWLRPWIHRHIERYSLKIYRYTEYVQIYTNQRNIQINT